MTRSLSLQNIYVEGKSDVDVLSRWFPHLQFEAAGGKEQVRSRVERDPASHGLLDRDFTPEGEVQASREPDSRVVIMRRYTIENYLLEPAIIAAAVRQLRTSADAEIQVWLDEAHTRQRIHAWARVGSLCCCKLYHLPMAQHSHI